MLDEIMKWLYGLVDGIGVNRQKSFVRWGFTYLNPLDERF